MILCILLCFADQEFSSSASSEASSSEEDDSSSVFSGDSSFSPFFSVSPFSGSSAKVASASAFAAASSAAASSSAAQSVSADAGKASASSSAGSDPSSSAVASGPSGGQVKLLHWFNDVKPTLKSGQTLYIYEPSSGQGWNLRIYSCGRHCDAEPASAEDTASMLKAFGGIRTWFSISDPLLMTERRKPLFRAYASSSGNPL